jgi:acyl-CoA synthetase (AMP-forming)/AMP-acid ligase II
MSTDSSVRDGEPLPPTVGAVFARAARLYPDRPAMHDPQCRWTFAELDALRRRAAQAFFAAGVQPGDSVAVWAPNIAEYVPAVAGLQSIGAVFIPLNTRFKTAEAAYILRKSRAVCVLTLDAFAGNHYVEMLQAAELPELRQVIVLRGRHGAAQSWADFLAAGDAAAAHGGAAFTTQLAQRMDAVGPDDTLDMMFTSGTTGHPKAVRFTHGQAIATYDIFATRMGDLHAQDRYLVVNPFFHTFGYKAGWLCAVMRGACIHPVDAFDAEEVMRRIQDERITVLPGPPTIFSSMLAHPRRQDYDLSSLRVSLTGATMIPIELIREMASELKIDIIESAYGLTETCGLVSTTLPEDPLELVAHTVGRAIPGLEIRCIDAEGRTLGPDEQGEIVLRGPNVLREYVDDPQGTAAAFTTDGFFRTGDLGMLDAQGNIRITGRLKDIYIVGGFNCYPSEIEHMLRQMEGVDQAAVVGVPDARMGEVGKAYIIRAHGSTITAVDVIAWASQNMANFKVPRYVAFVDAFPLNASLKVLKTQLRDMHDAHSQPVEPP